jgi:serine/threonine protein kinase/tetratricopeptide (TPR) repeat protein
MAARILMPASFLSPAPTALFAPRLTPANNFQPESVTGEPITSQPAALEITRRVPVGVRDPMGELRDSDPQTAERIDAALAEMPDVGQLFLGFHLVHELGRGAFGRVFLARQIALADRLVALKVSADLNGESQRLAQLQHTNIMPIFSEHRTGNLHAVCMPYYGSTTLADLYKALRAGTSMPTSGKQLVSTLFNRQSTLRNGEPSVLASLSAFDSGKLGLQGPATTAMPLSAVAGSLARFEQMSYVDTVLWIAARLAEGLAHAHERGIIHRDLKPANILLGDDGQPLLLDFNLAEDVKRRSAVAVAHVGGTLPYMSPEQLMAFRDGNGLVDGRSDIYSLGLIIFHLLTGQHAFPARKGQSRMILPRLIEDRKTTAPSLRALNRSISPAVEAIVLHCLEAEPERRYGSARQLAEDIERHRADMPLKHIPEPSFVERLAKWSRRHPRLASPATLSAGIAAIMLTVVSAGVYFSLESRKERLRAEMVQKHEAAVDRLHRFDVSYQLAQDLLTTDDPILLKQGLSYGEGALREYGVLERSDWIEQPDVKELAADERARLQARVGEIAFLLARAALFQPEKDGTDALDRALNLNRLASANLGGSADIIIAQQRADLKRGGEDTPEYQRMRAQLQGAAEANASARFLLAAEHAARGRFREALPLLDRAVGEDAKDFGSWFLKGRCHQVLDEHAEAVAAYGTAIALRPNYARAYVARAEILYAKQQNFAQAGADLEQAIKLQPGMLEARINRGLVLYALKKPQEAIADLNWALEQEGVPARVWFVRSLLKSAVGDFAGAAHDREEGLKTEPADPLSWVSRGMAKLDSDPLGALADFASAEALYPRCYEALHNQAYVNAAKLKKPEDAVAALDRLLKYYPDDSRALGYRAILLARLGRIDEAVTAAQSSLNPGATGEQLYRAACAFALISAKDSKYRNESLRLLSQALARGWGHLQLAGDSDLAPLKALPEFKQFVAFADLMKTLKATGAKD